MRKPPRAKFLKYFSEATVGKLPTEPGYYWAMWLTAAEGTHERNKMTFPESVWQIVEVWENFLVPTCEADEDEKWGVSVPGVRESQWLENFKWGTGPIR